MSEWAVAFVLRFFGFRDTIVTRFPGFFFVAMLIFNAGFFISHRASVIVDCASEWIDLQLIVYKISQKEKQNTVKSFNKTTVIIALLIFSMLIAGKQGNHTKLILYFFMKILIKSFLFIFLFCVRFSDHILHFPVVIFKSIIKRKHKNTFI